MTASVAASETPLTTEDASLPLARPHPRRLVGVNTALRPMWRRLADGVLIACAVGAVFWLVKTSWDALTWFIIGLGIFYLFLPVVTRLGRKLPRSVAGALTVALMVIAMAGFFVVVVPLIISQLIAIYYNLPTSAEVREASARVYQWYVSQVPDSARNSIDPALVRVREQINLNLEGIVVGMLTWLANLTSRFVSFIFFLLGFLVVPFWLIQLWSVKYSGIRLLHSLLSPRIREDVYNLIRLFDHTFSQYLRSLLVLAVSVGALVGLGLWLLRLLGFEVQYILLLALIAALTESLPIVGPIIGAIPAILLALFTTSRPLETTLAVIVVYLLVQQLENVILVPKITGDAVNIHPAVLMPLFIMLGAAFGLLGAIFAGPMAALGRDYFLYIHRRLSGATPRTVYHSLTEK